MGVEEHIQVVKPSLFIPNDMRVVLGTAEREGLEFHPERELPAHFSPYDFLHNCYKSPSAEQGELFRKVPE